MAQLLVLTQQDHLSMTCKCSMSHLLISEEGGCPQDLHAVDRNESSSNPSPLPGHWVLHFIQGQVKVLDHIPVTVPILLTPGIQEVICRLPH